MQPLLIKVTVPKRASFSINRYSYPDCFPGIWHFHTEYELTYIVKSSGTRLVGDHIDHFSEGDLIFIGKNLPHSWRNDVVAANGAEALVLHFLEEFLSPDFFKAPELEKIVQLMQRSKNGFKINGNTQKLIVPLLFEIETATGAERIIKLLSILHILSESYELAPLSSDGFLNSINHSDSERLNRVYEYIMNNFQEDISLKQVAAIANMSPTAFSRYFKNRTRKSFLRFLIEVKIGYACKLLMNEEMTVSGACYASGFQNLSNFNEQFKSVARMTPKKYQLLHSCK